MIRTYLWIQRHRWLLLVVWLLAEAAWARVGGGQGYRGGSSRRSGGGGYSGGGGGGDGFGFLIEIIFRLLFYYPQIGIPLLLMVLFFWFTTQRSQADVISTHHGEYAPMRPPMRERPPADPYFSQYVFRDFVGLLYTRVQLHRTSDLAPIRGYLSPEVEQSIRQTTEREGIREIREVIVGSARLENVRQDQVSLMLESNYTQLDASGRERRIYSNERWTFGRKPGVPSQPPEKLLKLGCPNCGQPGEIGSDGVCPYCQQVVNQGNFGWTLQSISVFEREDRKPLAIAHEPERGTDAPTVRHPQMAQRWRTFLARYPDFDQKVFGDRVRHIFVQLQEAWSQQKWELARPYETEYLFQTHRYWMEAYQRDGLINKLSDIRCTALEWSNVETDAFFDALTVRVFGEMIDVTVRADTGQVLSGDPKRPRRFSEYWTFIRKVGYRPPASQDPRSCPNCGGPLDNVNQAGTCEYCGSHLTLGEFDWVLAQIEQDESYQV